MECNVTNELIILLLKAVKAFVREDKVLLDRMVSERALCGALMLRLYSCLQDTQFAGYLVDVEFNKSKRLQGEEFLYEVKRLPNGKYITTDIIIHGRGMGAKPDNLIAIEMKKKTDGRQRYKEKRDADIERLKDLSAPYYIYHYLLGAFIEVNYIERKIDILLYKEGKAMDLKIDSIQFLTIDSTYGKILELKNEINSI